MRETGIAHKGRRNVRDPEFRCPHASPIHWKLFYMVSLCHDFPYGSSHRGSDRNVDTNNRKGIRKKALKGISGHLDPTLYSRGAPVLPALVKAAAGLDLAGHTQSALPED